VIAVEATDASGANGLFELLFNGFCGDDWFADAEKAGVLTADEVATLREMDELVSRVIAVDHFDPEAVKPNYQSTAPAASMGLAAE
ncbi:MAG: acyl-CoA dehydrogenase, partial [Pseudomonadota bacterium]